MVGLLGQSGAHLPPHAGSCTLNPARGAPRELEQLQQHPMAGAGKQGPCGVFGLQLAGRSIKRTQEPPPAWSREAEPTLCFVCRGSVWLQPVWETWSCLACLQVAGQDAELGAWGCSGLATSRRLFVTLRC